MSKAGHIFEKIRRTQRKSFAPATLSTSTVTRVLILPTRLYFFFFFASFGDSATGVGSAFTLPFAAVGSDCVDSPTSPSATVKLSVDAVLGVTAWLARVQSLSSEDSALNQMRRPCSHKFCDNPLCLGKCFGFDAQMYRSNQMDVGSGSPTIRQGKQSLRRPWRRRKLSLKCIPDWSIRMSCLHKHKTQYVLTENAHCGTGENMFVLGSMD